MPTVTEAIGAIAKTKQPKVFIQPMEAEMTEVQDYLTQAADVVKTDEPGVSEDLLQIPQIPIATAIAIPDLNNLSGSKFLRQVLLAALGFFVAMPVLMVRLIRELGKAKRKVAYVRITAHPSETTWASVETVKRYKPLGWGVWYQEIAGERFYGPVRYTETILSTFISPPGDWRFHYEPSPGVEFTVFLA